MAIIKKSHDQTVHFVHIVQKYRNGQMDEMDKMDTTKKMDDVREMQNEEDEVRVTLGRCQD